MLTEFSLNNEDEMSKWDDFVKAHPMGTPFHLSSWICTIRETYSFKPVLSVYSDGSGSIAGLLPCFIVRNLFHRPRIISIPFSDYCAPLTYDSKIEQTMLKDIVNRNRNRFKYIEIRGTLLGNPDYLCHNIYLRDFLELDPDPSKVYQNFDKRTIRYSIKKAEKAGVQIREDSSPEGIDEFYRLNKLTRKKHGIPCQPKTFFENIAKHMISQGHAFIILATYGSKVIAASLFLKLNKVIYYKYNASDPAYLSSKTPNHLLTWYIVRRACLEGYHTLDFGRTLKSNKGLIRYKKMWGTKSLDLPYYYYPTAKGAAASRQSSLLYKIETGIWRLMPDAIVDRLGPIIMKELA